MTMDPLHAFGLAADACKFVDFTVKIVSKGNKLRHSADGLLVEHADLYAASLKIIDLNNHLVESARNHSQSAGILGTDRAIGEACKAMNQVASDLLRVLDKLRMPNQRGRWKSMRQAVKATIGKHAVTKMKADLLTHRQALDTALLSAMWNGMDMVLAAKGYKEEDNKYAPIDSKMRERTVRFLYASSKEQPPIWQTRLVHKVLMNVWTTQNSANTESFSGEISRNAARETDSQLQLQLVHELRYPDLSDREYRVTAAHQHTFHWIFAGPNHRHIRKWCLFTSWLQSPDKIYWITGKPGSGKSTLMKFLSNDTRTRDNLNVWAADLPLVTAHFYFWNSGSQVQMSLHGFYRTVVHAILSVKPNLTPEVLPDRWSNSMLFGEDLRDWTDQELCQAFRKLVAKSGSSYRLCLFIDGLDEYEGDHDAFVDELSSLAAANDVKMCIASRPWPTFENAFSTGANLTLQDLTFPDIVRFTWSKLHSHRGFQNLVHLEAEYAGNLTLQIAEKSTGVFLWVDLVTKSLLQGLKNADGVRDLQRRLETIPDDLEKLYLKMFESIEPFYKEDASRYLRIARAGNGQLSALAFFFADDDDARIGIHTSLGPLSKEQRQLKYQMINTRLSGRCKGFLEIPNPLTSQAPELPPKDNGLFVENMNPAERIVENDNSSRSSEDSDRMVTERDFAYANPRRRTPSPECESGSENEESAGYHVSDGKAAVVEIPEPDRKVTYLHRTAKDFLESPKMSKSILEMSPTGFDPHISVLSARLLLVKTLPSNMVSRATLWHEIQEFLETATVAEQATDSLLINDYMDELDRTASLMFRNFDLCVADRHWTTTRWTSANSHHEVGFLSLAAEFNLKRYIISKLEFGIPVFESREGRPILDYIIEDCEKYPSLCEPSSCGAVLPSIHVINALLARGENPNFHFKNSTTWTRVLDEASKVAQRSDIGDETKTALLMHWADIVEIFIRHEADPLVNRNSAMASKVREIFGFLLPQRAKDMEKKLKITKRRWAAIGKFITPRNWKLDRLSFETTPLPVLKRIESAVIAPLPWSEHIKRHPGSGTPSIRIDHDADWDISRSVGGNDSYYPSEPNCVRRERRDLSTRGISGSSSDLQRFRYQDDTLIRRRPQGETNERRHRTPTSLSDYSSDSDSSRSNMERRRDRYTSRWVRNETMPYRTSPSVSGHDEDDLRLTSPQVVQTSSNEYFHTPKAFEAPQRRPSIHRHQRRSVNRRINSSNRPGALPHSGGSRSEVPSIRPNRRENSPAVRPSRKPPTNHHTPQEVPLQRQRQPQRSEGGNETAPASNVPRALALYLSEENQQLGDEGDHQNENESSYSGPPANPEESRTVIGDVGGSARPPSPINSRLASLNLARNRRFTRR